MRKRGALLVALVLGSAISIFYYLRTIYSFTGHAELDGGGAVAMTLMSKTPGGHINHWCIAPRNNA